MITNVRHFVHHSRFPSCSTAVQNIPLHGHHDKLCTHNNFARETNMCTHFTTSFFNSEFASTFPIPGCCKRPAALKRHGGAGGGEFLMTSLNLVGYWGRSGSCWWCLFFFFPSFCAALHNKVHDISNIRLRIQQ